MLVLTRKVNEAIQLGEDISVTVISIDADRVRIGIDAPRSLKIFRRELLVETAGLNREAAEAASAAAGTGLDGLKAAISILKPGENGESK